MSLQKLDIYNVRNLEKISISPSPGINLIYGNNAGGKSSLLEAVYLLGRAKSFRSHSIANIILKGKSELIVSGRLRNQQGMQTHLGIRSNGHKFDIRINGETKTGRSQLAYALPLQFIHPKSYTLLDGGAQVRREFIDWGVFNLYNDFLPAWKDFKKSLLQRNVLLKQKQIDQLEVWNHELAQYGTIVNEYRQNYMQLLKPVFSDVVSRFLGANTIELKYLRGWSEGQDYLRLLKCDLSRDLRVGYTHSGAHRSDFKTLVNGFIAKEYVSRGELKLLVLALKIAQVKLLELQCEQSSCLLIDDIASELDELNKEKLLNYLAEMNTQVFLTATHVNAFGDISHIKNYRMFHVEHGTVSEV